MVGRHRVVCGFVAWFALVAAACSQSSSASKAAESVKTPQMTSNAQQLWGEMKPIVSVKELMRDFIDPASDYVFDAVGTVVTNGKQVERVPKTDEDWDKIRMGAVMLAEGVYLLKVPRPFAPPGDENNSTGPEPEELSPAQIKAKLDKDPVLWNAKIEALRNVGLEVLEIVKKRNVDELWDASDNLDAACENCHLEFWYPGEREFLKRLDKKLTDMYGPRSDPKKPGKDAR